jgi:hypothetical protein
MIPYVDDGNPEFNFKVLNKHMPSCAGGASPCPWNINEIKVSTDEGEDIVFDPDDFVMFSVNNIVDFTSPPEYIFDGDTTTGWEGNYERAGKSMLVTKMASEEEKA